MSKLFKKTLLVVIGLFGLISVSVSVLSGWYIHSGMNQEFEVKGRSIASIISDASITPLLSENYATLQSMIDQYMHIVGVSYILVTDADNTPVAHTFVPAIPDHVHQLLQSPVAVDAAGRTEVARARLVDSADHINLVTPILGGLAGHVAVGMDKSIIRNQITSILLQQQVIIVLLLLFSILVSYLLINRISRPLALLNRHAEKLAETEIDRLHEIQSEIEPIASGSRDEIGALAQSFIYMEKALDASVRRLARNIASQERIKTELVVARDIQMRILPATAALQSMSIGTRVDALIQPAKEVGGDLFDCFYLPDKQMPDTAGEGQAASKRLFFAIGDVSGKGVPSALFMSLTCTLLRSKASHYEQPNELLKAVNKDLSLINHSCMFVTLFCGILDVESGAVTYCSAGHNPPYVMSPGRGVQALECKNGIALGAMDNAEYTNHTVTLSPRDTLFLFTDGVTEAMNRQEMLYSEQRLIQVLEQHLDAPPVDLLQSTLEDIIRFAENEPQADDITMLAIQRAAAS